MADKNKEWVNVDRARLERAIRFLIKSDCPPGWAGLDRSRYDGDCKRCWMAYLMEGGEDYD